MADLIEREALLSKIEPDEYYHSNEIRDMLRDCPTVTPESLVKHGRWINVDYWGAEQSKATGTCSCCKRRGELRTSRNDWGFWYIDMPYCPICGAVMGLEE